MKKYATSKYDGFLKSQKNTFVVIPVKTGIQLFQPFLDSGLVVIPGYDPGPSDGIGTFYETIKYFSGIR